MDVKKLTTVTDMFVICSGTSSRHVKSLATNLMKEVKKNKIPLFGFENDDEGEWVLVDLGDIVVHIMQTETREFYNIESLWQDM
jgi:ribosome-associated protein